MADPISAIVMGGIAVVSMGLPIGIVALSLHMQKERERRRREAAARIAHRFRLACSYQTVWGLLDGINVHVTTENRGSSKHPRWVTVVTARFYPPVDLGMSLRPHKFSRDLGAWLFGNRDFPIGDPVFDQKFITSADEAHRLAALLSPTVRFALVEAAAGSSEVLCSDHFVTMERDGEWDEAYASWALPMVVHIARALEAARSHVPPATKLMQLAHGYEKAARQLQLTWMATPLALGGDIDGIQVFAHASRLQQGTYGTVVHARFPASLGLGMSIKPRLGSTFLDMFADKDIQVGDAPFDEAFDLHGAEAERIVEALTADVRRELFALREQGTVHLTDMGIELHVQRIPQASEVPALVARMSDLAKLVLANVRSPDAVKGPYR